MPPRTRRWPLAARCLWLLGVACLLLAQGQTASRAQEPYAALLRITHDGVTIRRAGTDLWLPLSADAEAPFNPGDALRTDTYGRAYLTFSPQARLLVLPRSTYELADFSLAPKLILSARLSGHTVQQVAGDVGAFRLETPRMLIANPASRFAVWDREDEPAAVTSAEGSVELTLGADRYTVGQGQGLLWKQPDPPTVNDLDGPLTAPRLEGELYGCVGAMNTAHEWNVNIRVGTGLDSDAIGSIANGAPVRVMAINQSQTWYRIQAFSGFGWSQAILVKNDCANLPVLPDASREYNLGLWGVEQDELALLEPFYGPPDEDLWFYVSIRPPGG